MLSVLPTANKFFTSVQWLFQNVLDDTHTHTHTHTHTLIVNANKNAPVFYI